ncbi:unnamed protein product [Moneuplotes crassus]|uniref:Uncharacterized protein n=1 Tax=Euplotes crassus TaxID=5936 RepID=A0AAD1U485_EUPCR|nr:unnamed protein product [Moneuplotes crassus]
MKKYSRPGKVNYIRPRPLMKNSVRFKVEKKSKKEEVAIPKSYKATKEEKKLDLKKIYPEYMTFVSNQYQDCEEKTIYNWNIIANFILKANFEKYKSAPPRKKKESSKFIREDLITTSSKSNKVKVFSPEKSSFSTGKLNLDHKISNFLKQEEREKLIQKSFRLSSFHAHNFLKENGSQHA